MTVKELYEWAVKNGVEDYCVEVQYRDAGGFYSGTEKVYSDYINVDNVKSRVIL